VNGFLSGYVGEKILLGEGKQAWELMLAHYDQASDWGLETCEQPLNEDAECPGAEVKLTFPDALERMLNENSYKIEE
ncbi:MAG: serine protease, partial [Actinomycetota bacterium]